MKLWISLLGLVCIVGFRVPVFANNNIAYLYKVYAAEEAIMEGEYPAALQLYVQAFEIKKEKLFADDIYNALLCALETKDDKNANTLLTQLSKTGVGADFLKHHFEKYYTHQLEYFNTICAAADLEKNKFETKNKDLLAKLDSLYAEDYYFHSLWMNYNKEAKKTYDKRDNDSVFKVMNASDTRLSKGLKTVYDAGNPLSEFQLGAYVNDEQSLRDSRIFNLIILHNFQNTDTLFNQTLLQQINNGDIKPLYLSSISDWTTNNLKKNYGDGGHIIKSDGKIYFNKNVYGATDWNKELNQNRASIHLYPLQKQLERVYFNTQQHHKLFIIRTSGFSEMSEFPREFYKEYTPKQ